MSAQTISRLISALLVIKRGKIKLLFSILYMQMELGLYEDYPIWSVSVSNGKVSGAKR